MAKLTVSVDELVFRRAVIRAMDDGTTIEAVVSECIERYAGAGETASALREFLELADGTSGGPHDLQGRRDDQYEDARRRATELMSQAGAHGGRSWTRDELYDRPRAWRGTGDALKERDD